MYPSDQVWKGINKSLHGRKRWHWAGLAILLLGIGIYTGNYYLAGKPGNKLARNIEPSISATNENINEHSNTPNTSGNNITSSTPASGDNAVDASNSSRTQLLQSSSDLSNTDAQRNNAVSNNILTDNRNTSASPFTSYNNETSGIIINNPDGLNGAVTNNAEKNARSASIAITGIKEPSVRLEDSKTSLADAASESVLDEKKKGVNWLEDYAVFQLTPSKPKRLGIQIYFSPTVNYRKLSGSGNFPSSDLKSIPLSTNIMGDVDQYVKHKPALGFEIGSSLLYRTSKRITYKAGLQFNYSRYNIQAYQGLPEVATIALSNSSAFLADTISTISSIRNLSGYEQEDLSNQYFQVSMPIGLEFRVIGNEKLQLNIAGTLQPTYLINRNSYLITTDYKNYMREPSLVRRWNVNGGLEAYVSYNTGAVRWQVGPQIRYQLLSTYIKEYPIKEQLNEYGFKIAVSRNLR